MQAEPPQVKLVSRRHSHGDSTAKYASEQTRRLCAGKLEELAGGWCVIDNAFDEVASLRDEIRRLDLQKALQLHVRAEAF